MSTRKYMVWSDYMEQIKVTVTVEIEPHEEWEDHSYILEKSSNLHHTNKYGPIPDVLLPHVIDELKKIHERRVDAIVNAMMKGIDDYGKLS